MKRYWKLVLVAICLLAVDQLTKFWAYEFLRVKGPVVLIPGAFEFSYLENRGAAFGMLQGKVWLLAAITVITVAVILYLYHKIPDTKRYWLLRTCCTLILAGAVGNFADRCLRGFVVDFLYFRLIDFPVFNVADCYVVVGCITAACLLIFDKTLLDGKTQRETQEEETP